MDRLVFLSAAVLCLLAANVYVTWRVVRSPSYSASQKVVQVLLTWLLPIVGLLLVRSFLNEGVERPLPSAGEGLGEMGPMDLFTTNTSLTGGGHASHGSDP